MRGFWFGMIAAIFVLVVVGLAVLLLGYFPTNADSTPPDMERNVAMRAMDASMDRHAPRVTNPLPPTDENIIDGMKIYTMNCTMCHGALDRKPSVLAGSFYPPAPQLILYPVDDPEWHIFFAVRTGVRYTGMPAWNKALSEDEIWKVTAFLSRIEKLSPGVQDYWKKSYGAAAEPARSEGEGKETTPMAH